jgi:hypothetical protein
VWFEALAANEANEAMTERIVGHPLDAIARQWSGLDVVHGHVVDN